VSVHHRLAPHLADADRRREQPKFQRDPCARDVALDPGGTTMPRMRHLLLPGRLEPPTSQMFVAA
jgi:hypothetical protein